MRPLFGEIRRIPHAVILVLAGLAVCGGYWFRLQTNRVSDRESTNDILNGTGKDLQSANDAEVEASRVISVASYVGTEACIACHADQCRSLDETTHGHSLNEVETSIEPPDAEFEHIATGRHYRVYRQGDKLHHREFLREEDGREILLADYPMRYLIGSGHHTRSYLIEDEGYLVESPVTWYVSPARWDLSPGYEANNSGFGRPVNFECLFCHSGRVETVGGARSRLHVQSQKIDCERCHGPGSRHIEMRASHDLDGAVSDPTIINPGKLDRDKNESVCAQCHLHGDAVVNRRGKQLRDFLPGMSIHDVLIHFSLQNPDKTLTVVGHVEQLHASPCYEHSQTLTCITCHSPHSKLPADDRVTYFRQKCLECHDEKSCGMEKTQRLVKSAEDACVFCHMPKRSSDIPHLPATHHQIGIHGNRVNENSGTVGTLVSIPDLSNLKSIERDRYLGLAYLDLSIKDGHPTTSNTYRQRAQELLESVFRRVGNDPEVLVGLAQVYQRRNPQRSIELAQLALNTDSISFDLQVRGLYAISDSHIALRETNQAIPFLEQLTGMRRQAGDSYQLSACRLHAGDLSGALLSAQRAVQIRPDLANHHALLAEIYKQSNQPELSKSEAEIEQQIRNAAKVPFSAPSGTTPATTPSK
jgi:hypothetical protein